MSTVVSYLSERHLSQRFSASPILYAVIFDFTVDSAGKVQTLEVAKQGKRKRRKFRP
jgi:hypothetical protein